MVIAVVAQADDVPPCHGQATGERLQDWSAHPLFEPMDL